MNTGKNSRRISTFHSTGGALCLIVPLIFANIVYISRVSIRVRVRVKVRVKVSSSDVKRLSVYRLSFIFLVLVFEFQKPIIVSNLALSSRLKDASPP